MSYSQLPYHSNPFTHLCFLVSEALHGPRRTRLTTAAAPTSVEADLAEAKARAAAATTQPRPAVAMTWLDRLDQWAWRQTQKQREAYLAESTDLVDLEQRVRALEHSVGNRYY
jgi:hypothetical protein